MIYLELISYTSYSFQNQSAAYGFQTASEKMDVVIQIAILYVRIQSPYTGEQKGAGQNLPGISKKYFQECTFTAGESALFCVPGEMSAFRIKSNIAQFQKIGLSPLSWATHNTVNSCKKLFKGKRLDHVVVSPAVQACNLVFQLPKRRKKNDRGKNVCCSGCL